MSTRVVELELPVELPDGSEFQIQAECEVTFDPSYGADADGNRGEASYFTSPVVIKNMGELVKAVEAAVDNCSDDFIEEFQAEEDGDYDDEDYDGDEDEKPTWLKG